MASYTTNLNLLKKDPAADASDTFNIKTMLNDNWDKIDTAAGKKAEKAAPATAGNFAALDADGNLTDSGKKPTDFDASGAAGEAVKAHNSASDAHSTLFAGKQDKITASGILKGTGDGGVSVADAAALKTLLDTLSAVSPATGDKIPLTDISDGVVGFSTIADILKLVTPGAQIATGSYTGTGTYGSANPCRLTFPFVPRLLFITIHLTDSALAMGVFVYGVDIAPILQSYAFTGDGRLLSNAPRVSWGNTSVSWYSTEVTSQLNNSERICNYVVIG